MPIDVYLPTIGAVVLGSIAIANAYVVAEAPQGSDPALVVISVILGGFFFFMGAYNVIIKHRRRKMPVITTN